MHGVSANAVVFTCNHTRLQIRRTHSRNSENYSDAVSETQLQMYTLVNIYIAALYGLLCAVRKWVCMGWDKENLMVFKLLA